MACNTYNNLCPQPGDQPVNLLGKILSVLNNNGGGGGGAGVSSISVNGGPAETGAVSLTIPPASTPLLNFTDENADADAVIWSTAGTNEIFRVIGATGNIQLSGTNKRVHLATDDTAVALIGGTGKGTAGFIELYGQNSGAGIGGATISIHNGGQFRVRSAPQNSTVSVVRSTVDATTGFFGVGPLTTLDGLFHVNSEATDTLAILEQATADTSAISLHLRKARGSLSGRGIIVTADELGNIPFDGYDGTNFLTAASIEVVATGTVAATRVPGELRFRTATNATPSVLTTQLTINNAGVITTTSGTLVTPAVRLTIANQDGVVVAVGADTFDVGGSQQLISRRFSLSTNPGVTDPDILLFRRSAGVLGLMRLSALSAGFQIYETLDNPEVGVSYSRISLQTQVGDHIIQTEASGTGLTAGQPRILSVGTGPSVGTDIAAQSAIFKSGQSTGTGLRGAILFQQTAPGATGAAVNAYSTSWQINTAGALVATGGFALNAAEVTLSARISQTPVTLADAATIATNAALSNHFRVTLEGNRTLGNPTNPVDGQRVIWEFIQDGVGSRTIAFDTKFAFGSDITGFTLSTGTGLHDLITAVYNLAADKWYVVAGVHGYAS